jgi:hypothetical protein
MFDAFINHFGLTVSLGVIRCGMVKVDSLVAEQFFPEPAKEHRVSVTGNGSWCSMKFVDMIHECSGNCRCRIGMAECNTMSILTKTIHYDHDYILSL